MDQDEAAPLGPLRANGLAQKADLAAGAQEPLHPMGRRGDDMEQLGILRPEPRDIGVERAAVRPRGVGIEEMREHRAGLGAGLQEFAAGFG